MHRRIDPYLTALDAQLGSLDQCIGGVIDYLTAEKESDGSNPQYRYPMVPQATIDLWRTMLHAAEPNLKWIETLSVHEGMLGSFLLVKHDELKRRIETIRRIGNSHFTEAAEAYLGNWPIGAYERSHAHDVLSRTEPSPEEPKTLNVAFIQNFFRAALRKQHLAGWEVKAIQGESASISAHPGKKEIWINSTTQRSPKGLEKTVLHELQHVRRTENGLQQPLPYCFGYGCSGKYILLEEGLTTYLEAVHGLDSNKRRNAMFVLAVDAMRDGASYADVYKRALENGFTDAQAKDIAFRVKRGCRDTSKPGGFPKDAAYFLGYLKVLDLMGGNGRIPNAEQLLQLGKIAESDIPTVTRLLHAKLIKPPKFPLVQDEHPHRVQADV